MKYIKKYENINLFDKNWKQKFLSENKLIVSLCDKIKDFIKYGDVIPDYDFIFSTTRYKSYFYFKFEISINNIYGRFEIFEIIRIDDDNYTFSMNEYSMRNNSTSGIPLNKDISDKIMKNSLIIKKILEKYNSPYNEKYYTDERNRKYYSFDININISNVKNIMGDFDFYITTNKYNL